MRTGAPERSPIAIASSIASRSRALAHVGRVESAPIACDARQLGDLVCRGEATGRVDQARREAERSLLHRARERRFHGFHLDRGRRTIVPPDAPYAERREADPRADIDRRSLPLEPLEVSVQVAPVDRHAHGVISGALGLRRVAHRHNARDLAGDLGGHALEDLGDRAAVGEETELGMAEHVDEAGGDDAPGRVDRIARRSEVFAYICDPVTTDRDVRGKRGRAGSVDDAAASDQEIVRGHALTFHRGVQGEKCHEKGDARRSCSHAPTIVGVRIAASVIHLLLAREFRGIMSLTGRSGSWKAGSRVAFSRRHNMIGKYPILLIFVAAVGVAACSTGQEEVSTTPTPARPKPPRTPPASRGSK